jgi:hypothetical protein
MEGAMTNNVYVSAWNAVVVLLCIILSLKAEAAQGASDVEFLFAPSIDAIHRSALDPASKTKGDELVPVLDIIFSYTHKQLVVLGEYNLSEELQVLERLQLGWQSLSGTMVWAGRFHNPITYWHTQYHHGNYIRPTIDTPGIVSYEHHGGILPIHIGGIMVERLAIPGMNSVTADFSIGVGPKFHDGLEAFDLLNPNKHSGRKLSTVLRLVYGQESPEKDIMGVIVGYNEISSELSNITEVQLSTVGLFGIWEMDRLTLRGSVYAIQDKVHRLTGTVDKGSFVGGYFQAEYEWNNQWTAYGRLEDTSSEGNDPYLVNIEGFITKKQLAGLRFDFSEQQSLRLEFSNTELQTDRFDKVVLQWSAIFP